MSQENPRKKARDRRHQRVRAHVSGTPERPRLSVFRSLRHIVAQVIDDAAGRTLASASTLDPEMHAQLSDLNKTGQAKLVGKVLAERAQKAGVKQVVFDRGGYRYHGRVKALADASREAGLDF
jgi:large subunit ribosomal protein L18